MSLPGMLNEKSESSNTILCSFKTKRSGTKAGKILFRKFAADNERLIIGRIILKETAG